MGRRGRGSYWTFSQDLCQIHNWWPGDFQIILSLCSVVSRKLKGAVSQINSAKLGNYKIPVKFRET